MKDETFFLFLAVAFFALVIYPDWKRKAAMKGQSLPPLDQSAQSLPR